MTFRSLSSTVSCYVVISWVKHLSTWCSVRYLSMPHFCKFGNVEDKTWIRRKKTFENLLKILKIKLLRPMAIIWSTKSSIKKLFWNFSTDDEFEVLNECRRISKMEWKHQTEYSNFHEVFFFAAGHHDLTMKIGSLNST